MDRVAEPETYDTFFTTDLFEVFPQFVNGHFGKTLFKRTYFTHLLFWNCDSRPVWAALGRHIDPSFIILN